MAILDFVHMNDDDDATYVTALVEGAAKMLKANGQEDQARKAIALFKNSTKSGGVNQPTTIKKERQPWQSSSDNQRADRPRWLSVNRTFWLTLSSDEFGGD